MLQIPTIGRKIAIRILEMRRVRTITPELLATIPYIKMEVLNQYIDYTSLNEFEFEEQDNEFEDQDELDYEQQDDLVDFDDKMTQSI
jgi:predicted DNA-binding helix-hairpin-helix protein